MNKSIRINQNCSMRRHGFKWRPEFNYSPIFFDSFYFESQQRARSIAIDTLKSGATPTLLLDENPFSFLIAKIFHDLELDLLVVIISTKPEFVKSGIRWITENTKFSVEVSRLSLNQLAHSTRNLILSDLWSKGSDEFLNAKSEASSIRFLKKLPEDSNLCFFFSDTAMIYFSLVRAQEMLADYPELKIEMKCERTLKFIETTCCIELNSAVFDNPKKYDLYAYMGAVAIVAGIMISPPLNEQTIIKKQYQFIDLANACLPQQCYNQQ